MRFNGFGMVSAQLDLIATQSGYTDGSDPSRGPNWYNSTLTPSRDWSFQYKKLLAQGRTPLMLKYVQANAAREGVVLDEQGNVLGTLVVALTPGTDDLVALIDSGTFGVQSVQALINGFNVQMAQQSAKIAVEAAKAGDAYAASTAAATVKLVNDTMPDIGVQDVAHAAVAAAQAVGGNVSAPQTVSTLPVQVTQAQQDQIQAALAPSVPAPAASAPPAQLPVVKKSWAPVVAGAGGGFLVGGPIGAVAGGILGLIARK